MAEDNTVGVILGELSSAFRPLKDGLSSVSAFEQFMKDLGWNVDIIPPPVESIASGISTMITELENAQNNNFSASSVSNLLTAFRNVIDGIDQIKTAPDALIPAILRDENFREEFPVRVVEYLIVRYLHENHPRIGFWLSFTGVIKIDYVAKTANRPAYMSRRIDLAVIPQFFTNPLSIFETNYGWGTDDFNAGKFLRHIEDLLIYFGAHVGRGQAPAELNTAFGVPAPTDPLQPGSPALNVLLFSTYGSSGFIETGLTLVALPKEGTKKPGLALVPFAKGAISQTITITPELLFMFRAAFDVQGGLGVELRPESGLRLIVGFNDGPATHATGEIQLRLENRKAGEHTYIMGSGDGSYIRYDSLSLETGLKVDASDGVDLYIEAELVGGAVALKPGADGFLQKILPAEGIGGNFDTALGWSLRNGVYFRGSGGLEIRLPSHIDLGPISIEGLTMTFKVDNGEFPLSIGADIKAALGPLTAVVQNMGITATFSFPSESSRKNLGLMRLEVDFKPPNGVGLSIDAGGLKGAGFLYLDFDKGEYLGALELEFKNTFALKAVGIINTKMPDGTDGFALLIIITTEFTPIQLGFGFSLNGVGGLLGLNRTVRIDVLREGVKTGALNSVLFPQNVVANINRIVSDLKQIFPIEEGHFLIGPMVKIGWGSSILTLELGLLLDIPRPMFAILGVLKMVLPTEEAAVLKLQVNFLGVVDFENKYISFDATLFDSRLLIFTLTGDMALRINWGETSMFVLSVGGFHPAFHEAPADLQHMTRITLALLSGSNPRITIECYFAVTSNTVQFGAKAELYAGACGFSIQGYIGFDVLFQFDPFRFIAEIYAGLALKMGSTNIMSLRLRGSLAGPEPWDVKGEASFSILFFEITISFHETWGDDPASIAREGADVLELLKEQVAEPRNWKADIPDNNHLHVTVKTVEAPGDSIVIHPFGVLSFNQTLVPLNFTINKFGEKVPSGDTRFALTDVKTGTTALSSQNIKDRFAPAQFTAMKDSDKLSSPSFAKMDSGFELTGSSGLLMPPNPVSKSVEYEVTYLRNKEISFAGIYKIVSAWFKTAVKGSAVANSKISYRNNKVSGLAPAEVKNVKEEFVIANVSDMRQHAVNLKTSSYAGAVQLQNELLAQKPALKGKVQVLSTYELNRS